MAIVSAGATAQNETPPVTVTPIEVSSIPAARQANRVAIITVEGIIDPVTSVSVQRRIKEAERGGFDAFVLEVNSPGGVLYSCLEISQAIKASSIKNTVAWVNNEAHSGGAVIAMACSEIVTNDPSSFGDALIVLIGPGMMRALTPDERTKMLPPLMTDVVDSARRNGYDEYLVQALVTDGVELWQVEDVETGERLAINEAEYRMLFDGDPIRGRSMLVQVTGGTQTYREPARDQAETEDGNDEPEIEDAGGDDVDEGLQDLPTSQEEALKQYRPASDTLEDVQREIADDASGLSLLLGDSQRVTILPEDKGRYRLVGYLCDGSSAIVMRTQDMRQFGLSSGVIGSDEELKAFFGAKSLVRTNESVFEKIVRFLTSMGVRYVLIAIFLLAIGVEMLTGGTGIAGAVSLGALALLIGPGLLLGLNGWWEIIAIVSGLICIVIEIFIMPGFGVFGILGFVLVFGGLIGTFVSAGGSMSSPQTQQQLMHGTVVTLLALVTAGVGWWLFIRKAQDLPLFQKLMLNDTPASINGPQRSLLHAIVADDGSVREGDIGVTTTPLYPIGQADFDGNIHDVYSAFGTIERGERVRVVKVNRMRIEVEPVGHDDAGGKSQGEA
jgi:membrane-bound ClpP family serine protease